MNAVAPKGQMYACGACGKRSRDRYGIVPIDPNWDESCMMHAVLVTETAEKQDHYKAVSE